MLYADSKGRIYDHPHYGMAGFAGNGPSAIAKSDLMPMPEFSKLFYIPECPPIGVDLCTGAQSRFWSDWAPRNLFAVAAFPEAELVVIFPPRLHFKKFYLPCGDTAIGFKQGKY
jgi:hypothetical protein